MLTSKTIPEIKKNILNFLGARNVAMNLFQVDLDKPWNYPWHSWEKAPPPPLPLFWKDRGEWHHCGVFLDSCKRWSTWSNQWISATFILIPHTDVELANLWIYHHRYKPISICRNCILWPESTVQTHKLSNSQHFVACAWMPIAWWHSLPMQRQNISSTPWKMCFWVRVDIFFVTLQKAYKWIWSLVDMSTLQKNLKVTAMQSNWVSDEVGSCGRKVW